MYEGLCTFDRTHLYIKKYTWILPGCDFALEKNNHLYYSLNNNIISFSYFHKILIYRYDYNL